MDNSNDDIALGIAARHWARLAAADCSAADREACERWRSDPNNDLVFRQVAALAARIDNAIKVDERLQMLAARAFADAAVPESDVSEERALVMPSTGSVKASGAARSKYRVPVSLAAGVMLATVAVWMTMFNHGADSDSAIANAEMFSAPDKAARQVTLSDGSTMHIDAGGKVTAAIGAHDRRITVLAGRVLFEVAHDAQRPFIVTANDTQTVALGTEFEVDRRDAQTTVTLIEGSVGVSSVNLESRWNERLAPGDQLHVPVGNTARTRSEVDTDGIISWSRGWLVFRGARLDDAVREINRYSGKQITLAEASLADLTVAGSFLAGESESIASAIAEVLPIRVVDGGSREIILFKRYDN